MTGSAAATQGRRIVVLGGTSEIALATLQALNLRSADHVVLAGRSPAALDAAAALLPAPTRVQSFDALAWDQHETFVRSLFEDGPVDLLLVAFGILGDQQRAEDDPRHALEILDVDLRAQASVLLYAANQMRMQGHGRLVVFSSIAATRARRANFVYGAAKAGLDAFASGLADSLHGSGVQVLVVRPGFVVGRMTAGRPRAPLAVTPERVGQAVASALARDDQVVWIPRRLSVVAAVLRLVPRSWWRRLRR